MSRSRILGAALLASSLAATAACASILGIDTVGYGDPPPTGDAAGPDGGVDAPSGDAGDAADACADGGCCVCPTDASCVGSCVARIYAGPNGPIDLAGGGDFLYWRASQRQLFRCQTPDCANAGLVASIPSVSLNSEFVGLAADERAAFFGNTSSAGPITNSRITRCGHGDNCNLAPAFAFVEGFLDALAVDDASVAWMHSTEGMSDAGLYLGSCSSSAACDAGMRSVLLSDLAGLKNVGSFALATPYAFWVENGTIKNARLDGVGGAVTVRSGTSPTELLFRGGYLYFFEVAGEGGTKGELRRCTGTGACDSSELVAGNVTLPARLTSDETALYWTADEPGGLQVFRWRFTRPLGEVERIAIAEGTSVGITNDRGRLYWAAGVDGGAAVYRLAK
ncbi:MAG: hypothetical protein JST00_13770 [Deltaproteobacteria bacterium]|nr:hypothetical protein [Deltaproteobacteria bacterium]